VVNESSNKQTQTNKRTHRSISQKAFVDVQRLVRRPAARIHFFKLIFYILFAFFGTLVPVTGRTICSSNPNRFSAAEYAHLTYGTEHGDL
jgi:hypothetical protein